MELLFQIIEPYMCRKLKCKVRSLSRECLRLIQRPKLFRSVDASSVAKTRMILNLKGKTMYQRKKKSLYEIVVNYKNQFFDYESMMKRFPWFQKSIPARLFFMAYKHKVYDSRLVAPEKSFTRHVQLGEDRADLIEAASVEEVCKIGFFIRNLVL
jgi:hypothetical protein